MSVSHVGGGRPLPLVPPQVSTPKSDPDAPALDRNLLPETRKFLPEQAKGVAGGLSVQKVFDHWDKDGDGQITAAEAGPRFGHGILGQLLQLQESGGADDAADAPAPVTDGAGDGASDSTDGVLDGGDEVQASLGGEGDDAASAAGTVEDPAQELAETLFDDDNA